MRAGKVSIIRSLANIKKRGMAAAIGGMIRRLMIQISKEVLVFAFHRMKAKENAAMHPITSEKITEIIDAIKLFLIYQKIDFCSNTTR